MTNSLSGLKALALIVATTLLGCMGARFLFDVFEYRLPGGEWRPISLGQEKAIHLLGISAEQSAELYIQTDQDKVYSCAGLPGELFDSFMVQCTPASTSQALRVSSTEQYYIPPQPPGDVSESLVGPGAYEGLCSGQTNFVILKDGTVWSWSKVGCCEVGCVFNLVYPLGGMTLGCVIGIVIVVVKRRRAEASRQTS